jgi:hypothetical protein
MAKLLRKTLVIAAFAVVVLAGSSVQARNLNVATVVPQSGLNLRSGAGTDHSIVRVLPTGTAMYVLACGVDWAPVRLMDGTEGWISAHHIVIRPDLTLASRNANSNTNADRLITFARQFLGTPYVFGGSSPAGFDCSGFTQYVYREFGFHIGRTAQSQLGFGRAVERSDLQKGDLVFFGSSANNIVHVAIYMGNGDIIHGRRPGVALSISKLSDQIRSQGYVGARRLL